MDDFLHVGAAAIAQRFFGRASEREIKRVYRWSSVTPEQRPFDIVKLGPRLLAASESAIAAALPAKTDTAA